MPKDDLSGKNLDHISLTGTNLAESDLQGVSLEPAELSGAILRNADLTKADLRGVDLDRAASIEGAKLTRAKGGLSLDGGAGRRWGDISDACLHLHHPHLLYLRVSFVLHCMVMVAESSFYRFCGEVNVLQPSEEFLTVDTVTPLKASLEELGVTRDHR